MIMVSCYSSVQFTFAAWLFADEVGWWMVVKNGQEGWAPSN